ncbi:hypothetical protein [Agrobacterium genomosp. 2]|uniref:hypothetical protein n=1 Tax=Agrobacterium genomosp. 2 TaxID=1183409 RepID=UPI00111BA64B|nr:hypothetical protein [Agrobacterium genomosp. 2]
MAEIDDKCGCCGRPGHVIGDGDEARIRCVRHENVVNAEEWKQRQDAIPVMFETEAEALTHFLADYGDGLDFMQEMACEDAEHDPDGEDPNTRH